MPLQRPANHGFSEAASHLRRYHIWTIHDTSPAAAASTESSSSGDGAGDASASTPSQLRRPSMRPLDHRWDRSRGIFFSGHHQRRSYATKPISRVSPARTPAVGPTKGFGPSSAVSAVDSGWKSGPTSNSSGYSGKQVKDLEKKNRDLNEDIKGLQARIKEQKAIAEMQENQMALLKDRVAEMVSKLESAKGQAERDLRDQDARLASVKSQAERDLRDQDARHRRKLESLSDRIAENKEFLDKFRSETQEPLVGQIDRLRRAEAKYQEELQGWKTALNEQQQGHESAFKQQQQQYETVMEDQRKRHETAMEDQQKRHETAIRNANANLRDTSIVLDKVKKEIQAFRSRKQEDREDYTRYQGVFADLNDKIFQVRDEVQYTRRRVEEDGQLWQKSLNSFRTSNNLRLFLLSSKYEATKKAIEEYLEEQVARAKTTEDGMMELARLLMQRRIDMQPTAHNSRALTRHLHLDERQSAYNSAQLAQRLATLAPFQELHQRYHEEIEHLSTLLEEPIRRREDRDEIVRIQVKIQELKSARTKVQHILTFFTYVQEWRALQALQDDDIVEKAVWVDTVKAKQALDSAATRLYDDMDDHPTRNAEQWAQRRHYREDLRVQRIEFDNLVAQVRQRHLLAHDLSKMTENEESQVEQTIRRQTELAKSAVDGSLVGLGFQKPSTSARQRKFTQSSSINTVIDASTTSKTGLTSTTGLNSDSRPTSNSGLTSTPRPTITKLGPSLAKKVSTKKRRVGRAEKKSIGSKSLISKASGGRKRLGGSDASSRSLALDTSCEKPETDSEGVTKAKADVSGSGVSGLQPTKPMQARYRRAAYDIEGETSKSGKRASRGDNMGFSTLKATLARSNISDDTTETDTSFSPPTATINDLELSSSEDSASVLDQSDDEILEESPTVLSYQIPPKDYRDAVMASPNSNAAYWSHTLYKNAENQKPVVYYCQSYEATEARAKLFLNEPVLGFDMEWEPHFSMKAGACQIKRNVSLIQIAAEDKIGLFQLARFRTAKTAEDHMPPSLRKILESADVAKAGVNISGDATRLKKYLGVEMKGIFELSHMFRVVKQSKGSPVSFKLVKLMEQVQEVLLLPLKKDDVRVSAWSKELNTQQTSYAAADAYAGFQLYHRLDNARKAMVPKPPRPAFYETMQPIVLGDGTAVVRSGSGAVKKPAAVKKGEVVVEEEEEEEEFFDAPEGLDTYEIGDEPEISGSIPNPDDSRAFEQTATNQGISYPSLPSVDRGTGKVAASTPAPSRTTTLPLRAKLTSKVPAPAQPAKTTSTEEEEEIQAQSSASQSRPGPLPCPEIQAAETWVITYRSKHSGENVGIPSLRAYHLWHHQRFELREVAGFCRDPPLAITTVASYIMQALKEAELPFDGGRVETVLDVLPGSVHGRYKGVLDRGGIKAV